MPFIKLPEGLPGIRGPMAFRPETAVPLSELAEILLRGESTLSRAERELIATYVSAGNGCDYCRTSHGAIAAQYLGGDESLVASVCSSPEGAPVAAKLKALLAIAGKVRESGKNVTEEDITRARREGASDVEIHDTVLIAAAFAMFNRYVDGLATWTPEDPDSYRERAAGIVRDGYVDLARRLKSGRARAR
ncbi:MAG TPA: peroxidase-related enzyme [Vicinamibacteria bacterium]|nr:peroxidase-related enzyme [Vicinamibacteria bacterium]